MDGRLEVQFYTKYRFPQEQEAFGVEYKRCATLNYKTYRSAEVIDYRNTKKTTALPELLQEKSISSSNTRSGALKLDTVVVEYMKKGLAQSH